MFSTGAENKRRQIENTESISLSPSIFQNGGNSLGLFFSYYDNPVLFPLTQDHTQENDTIATSVLGAMIVGQTVDLLEERVVIILHIQIEVMLLIYNIKHMALLCIMTLQLSDFNRYTRIHDVCFGIPVQLVSACIQHVQLCESMPGLCIPPQMAGVTGVLMVVL